MNTVDTTAGGCFSGSLKRCCRHTKRRGDLSGQEEGGRGPYWQWLRGGQGGRSISHCVKSTSGTVQSWTCSRHINCSTFSEYTPHHHTTPHHITPHHTPHYTTLQLHTPHHTTHHTTQHCNYIHHTTPHTTLHNTATTYTTPHHTPLLIHAYFKFQLWLVSIKIVLLQ